MQKWRTKTTAKREMTIKPKRKMLWFTGAAAVILFLWVWSSLNGAQTLEGRIRLHDRAIAVGVIGGDGRVTICITRLSLTYLAAKGFDAPLSSGLRYHYAPANDRSRTAI